MKKLLITSVVIASLLTPFAASALIIDHFNVGNINITTPGAVGTSVASGWIAGDAVGGSRQVIANQVAGATPNGVSANANPPSSVLALSSKDSVDALWQLQYFGGGGGISPAANFSAGGALGIFILFGTADLGGGSVWMQAYDGVNLRSSVTQSVPVGATTMFFPFSTFTVGGGGPVNFANIVDFEVDIAGVNSYDSSVDLLETRQSGQVPDATGTMVLMTIALSLLGAARLKMSA